VGLPIKDIRLSNIDVAESFAKVLHSNGLTYMSFVSPEYWGDRQYGARRYYEYNGGEGIIAQWESIISDQLPEWVELTTWNDWTEGSYFSPIDNIEDYVVPLKQLHPEKGFYKSHKGYGELSKYYIQWYKTGSKPAIHKDEIFYFYRTQSKDAITNDPVGRVAGRAGDVEDVVYITSFLTAPAQLIVKSGNVTQNFNLQKGINNTRVPFQPGKQYFKVLRNNKIVINQQGQDIESSPASYNFNVYSGYAISEK
jgi:glucan endo-1,3-alpha-glucosidase